MPSLLDYHKLPVLPLFLLLLAFWMPSLVDAQTSRRQPTPAKTSLLHRLAPDKSSAKIRLVSYVQESSETDLSDASPAQETIATPNPLPVQDELTKTAATLPGGNAPIGNPVAVPGSDCGPILENLPSTFELTVSNSDSRDFVNQATFADPVEFRVEFDKPLPDGATYVSARLSIGSVSRSLDLNAFANPEDRSILKWKFPIAELEFLEGRIETRLALVVLQGDCTRTLESKTTLSVDKTAPAIFTHRVFTKADKLFVDVIFRDTDLDANSIPGSFRLLSESISGSRIGSEIVSSRHELFNSRTLRLEFESVPTGSYQIDFNGIKDKHDNTMANDTLRLSVAGNVPAGEPTKLVEFPEFIEARNRDGTRRRFNPADHVETRVARLFYFRDAHRVAQIINRITESYNRAAVKQADQRFQEADNDFEEAKRARQLKESEAIRLAEQTRFHESKLRRLNEQMVALRTRQASFADVGPTVAVRQANLEEMEQLNQAKQLLDIEIDRLELEIDKTQRRIDFVNQTTTDSTAEANSAQAQIAELRTQKFNLEQLKLEKEFERDSTSLKLSNLSSANQQDTFQSTLDAELGINELQDKIDEAASLVQSGRQLENEANAKIRELSLDEDRLAKERFKLLTTARNKDPDTFAPGDIDSIDPVARVSVSVIGEGMLQLRGPINGINKIRLMIHQIDSPRGQVKIDVNTIQINGEDQRRMEKVAGKVEAQIALGRHLTMQSLELLRKAVVQEASRIAGHCGNEEGYDSQEQKYLYNFFGGDFLRELQAMDSEFLRSGNKILSLHSMDVVSPSNALFIFLLARNDVRQNIYANFLHLVETELPHIEWEYRRQLELIPYRTRKHLPFKSHHVVEEEVRKRVCLNALQRYTFRNFKTYFEAQGFGANTLNPAQREFVRLAQIFKAQMIAEAEVKQRIVERAMVEDESLVDIEAENKLNGLIRDEVFKQMEKLPQQLVAFEKELIRTKRNARDAARSIDGTGPLNTNNQMTNQLGHFASRASELLKNAEYKLFGDNKKLLSDVEELRRIAPDDYQKPIDDIQDTLNSIERVRRQREAYTRLLKENRRPVNKQKLLDYLIEEKIEKQIELLEGTRAQISTMDNYIKRLVTALEDDFQQQFYDPSFIRMRRAATKEAVHFSQADRTTLLMNNRDIGIVHPTATMEFDLPRRDILIVETLDTARAIAQDYGALLQDPTYLAVFDMLGGGQIPTKTQKVLPGLPSLTDEYSMGLSDSRDGAAGSALQGRVQDPAIYQFETGTGFEIRPVIQPDGHSLAYDFHYMYTSEIREPVRPDEKHLGRVKRHFIDTQVQTSSFEMREVGRYLVGLKAARTSSGVPGLQNIPIVGRAFRPAPSAESSLQQNIVLAKNTIYPTLYDLMGLRWARQVVDLNHHNVKYDEFIVRNRQKVLEYHVFDETSRLVDDVLGIRPEKKIPTVDQYQNGLPNDLYRTDLYRRQDPIPAQHPSGDFATYGHQPVVSEVGGYGQMDQGYSYPVQQMPPNQGVMGQPMHHHSPANVPVQGEILMEQPIDPNSTAPAMQENFQGARVNQLQGRESRVRPVAYEQHLDSQRPQQQRPQQQRPQPQVRRQYQSKEQYRSPFQQPQRRPSQMTRTFQYRQQVPRRSRVDPTRQNFSDHH